MNELRHVALDRAQIVRKDAVAFFFTDRHSPNNLRRAGSGRVAIADRQNAGPVIIGVQESTLERLDESADR
jgi:hypothetical protein